VFLQILKFFFNFRLFLALKLKYPKCGTAMLKVVVGENKLHCQFIEVDDDHAFGGKIFLCIPPESDCRICLRRTNRTPQDHFQLMTCAGSSNNFNEIN
jgi:hypothetical protein